MKYEDLVEKHYYEELYVLTQKSWWPSAEKELKDWLKAKALERAHNRTKKELNILD